MNDCLNDCFNGSHVAQQPCLADLLAVAGVGAAELKLMAEAGEIAEDSVEIVFGTLDGLVGAGNISSVTLDGPVGAGVPMQRFPSTSLDGPVGAGFSSSSVTLNEDYPSGYCHDGADDPTIRYPITPLDGPVGAGSSLSSLDGPVGAGSAAFPSPNLSSKCSPYSSGQMHDDTLQSYEYSSDNGLVGAEWSTSPTCVQTRSENYYKIF